MISSSEVKGDEHINNKNKKKRAGSD